MRITCLQKRLPWLLLVLVLGGCETGHLWSLYSLGYSKRDAYVNSLSDARDALQACMQHLSALSDDNQAPAQDGHARAQLPQNEQNLQQAKAALDSFNHHLRYSNRIANDWLPNWQRHPQKFHQGLAPTEVARSQSSINKQGNLLASRLAVILDHLERENAALGVAEADAWQSQAEQFLQTLAATDAGYRL